MQSFLVFQTKQECSSSRDRVSQKDRSNGTWRGAPRARVLSQQHHLQGQPQQQNPPTQPTPGYPQQEKGSSKIYHPGQY